MFSKNVTFNNFLCERLLRVVIIDNATLFDQGSESAQINKASWSNVQSGPYYITVHVGGLQQKTILDNFVSLFETKERSEADVVENNISTDDYT